ncbi:hypothetical protein QJQ45_001304 [Haematococcus lacustris]|nr:hypothetical protein QJQ45_001304 [Haematococcus lacustris]
MRTATDLQMCQEQLHQSQQALQQSENEVLAVQVSLHRSEAESAAAKEELAACMSKERDTATGAYTAAYACSNAALLTLPNVSCQQLGPLRTAVAAAEFPDAPPQPQAGPSTVRRHQLMLTCDIQRTFEGLLRQAPAIHIQMDGCTITSGKVVLYCASAAIPAAGPRLPTLAADPPTPAQILAHGQEPSRILCRVIAIRKCLDSTAAAQAQDLEQLLTEANLWGLLASVTVDSAASNVGRTGGLVALVNVSRRRQDLAPIMFWPCLSHLYHNVLHQGLTAWGKAEDRGRQGLSAEVAFGIERLCSLIMGHWDGLPNMGVWHKPSFPTLTRWGSFVTACVSLTRVLGPVTKAVAIIMLITAHHSAHRRYQWQEQQQEEERQQDHGNRKRMRRPLPPQSCNPAEYDPFNTISMFSADIEAMAANEECSPRLFMHLVHFFGAAPTSNAHVESALQHAKHGHGSKQGLAALLGTVIAKTDPASFRTMDAVDLQPRMKALRKEQRDMERASAAKTAVARAARKAVMESCMVGGNKQLVLNIGTVASLGQLRAASSRHPRGADYSATTLEEAAAFTLAQLWGYINFYKIPPKHRPAQKTLLHNLRRFVKQHIEQRTKAALSSGPGGVA